MKFLFDDESFSFETMRTAGFALYGGADLGEAAAALLDSPVQDVSIPYADTTLPAYLFLVDDSGVPRPTIINNSGYDSTREESYFAIAAAALRRGYKSWPLTPPARAPRYASRSSRCARTGKR